MHDSASRGSGEARTAPRAVVAAAFFGFTGVCAGAFGAHALRAQLDAAALAVFETGARYQLVHAAALLGAAFVAQHWPGRYSQAATGFFCAGIALFSGSLYALALTGIRPLGAVTPVGGACFLAGWLCLGLAAARGPRT